MRHLFVLLLACSLCLAPACGDKPEPGKPDTPPVNGAGAPPAIGGAVKTTAKHGLDAAVGRRITDAGARGRAYLLTQQDEKGGFGDKEIQLPANVAYTAMAVNGIVAVTESIIVHRDEAIREGLAFLVSFQQENGSIVDNPQITNYCTSAAVSALAAARIGDYRKAQSAASAYLAGSQIADDPENSSFGGFPYKAEQSADASNALMAANALDDDRLDEDSEVRARVGQFVSRVLNNSESNPGEQIIEVDGEKRAVVAGDGGGGFYRPGESKAGMTKRSDGKWELNSYGSMTYAALKLLMFAGVQTDDARVQGVVRWIANHWTLERNPGFENSASPEKDGQQGMYYYLYTATRALSAYEKALGAPLIVKSEDGREHNWRAEIAGALLARQAKDGSWRNEVADRWEEGSKTLATSFALQTFGYLTGRLE